MSAWRTGLGAALIGLCCAVAPAGAGEGGDGDELASQLVKSLGARRHLDRARAEIALRDLEEEAVPALLAALRDQDARVRAAAARILGRLGDAAPPEVAGSLIDLLEREIGSARVAPADATVCDDALVALASLEESYDAVIAIAEGRDPEMAALRPLAERAMSRSRMVPVKRRLREASTDGSYRGRFVDLRKHGRFGVLALVDLAGAALPGRSGDKRIALFAIQALGDGDDPTIPTQLEQLAERYRRDAGADPEFADDIYGEIARALHWQGHPARLDAIITGLRARAAAARRPSQFRATNLLEVLRNLAHRLLARELYDESAEVFVEIATRFPDQWSDGYYNAACAHSLAGRVPEAAAAIRAMLVGPDGRGGQPLSVDWMDEDGDLANLRRSPDYPYLHACALTRRAGRWVLEGRLEDAAHRRVLTDLRLAHARGYRVTHPEDLRIFFLRFRGTPEFDTVWAEMGGPPNPPPEMRRLVPGPLGRFLPPDGDGDEPPIDPDGGDAPPDGGDGEMPPDDAPPEDAPPDDAPPEDVPLPVPPAPPAPR